MKDIDKLNKNLIIAAQNNRGVLVKAFIERGANPNYIDPISGRNALDIAIENNNPDIIEILRAALNPTDEPNQTEIPAIHQNPSLLTDEPNQTEIPAIDQNPTLPILNDNPFTNHTLINDGYDIVENIGQISNPVAKNLCIIS